MSISKPHGKVLEVENPTAPPVGLAMSSRPRLVPVPWSEITRLPKRENLIGGLLDCTAMSVVFGGSNVGKTFFVLDLSVRVALAAAGCPIGDDWRGRKVRPGAVVYIAAEGGLGIKERLTAFSIKHDIDPENVPFYVIPEPISLAKTEADADLLITRIAELSTKHTIVLIIIDTLSRAMAGGNENSPDDMGGFVSNCDKIRAATGAHVLIIHHAGKDDSRGARGHSLLRGATDTEIEVTRKAATGLATATVVKQRDHAGGDAFGFSLESVEIGQNGKPETSCIVVEAYSGTATPKRRGRPNKSAMIALRALAEAVSDCGKPANGSPRIPHDVKTVTKDEWRAFAVKMGISASADQKSQATAFRRAFEDLVANQSVGVWNDRVWLP